MSWLSCLSWSKQGIGKKNNCKTFHKFMQWGRSGVKRLEKEKNSQGYSCKHLLFLVGGTGLEPATSGL